MSNSLFNKRNNSFIDIACNQLQDLKWEDLKYRYE